MTVDTPLKGDKLIIKPSLCYQATVIPQGADIFVCPIECEFVRRQTRYVSIHVHITGMVNITAYVHLQTTGIYYNTFRWGIDI